MNKPYVSISQQFLKIENPKPRVLYSILTKDLSGVPIKKSRAYKSSLLVRKVKTENPTTGYQLDIPKKLLRGLSPYGLNMNVSDGDLERMVSVYAALLYYDDGRGENGSDPNLGLITRVTRISKNTITKITNLLQKQGWIVKRRRYMLTNKYYIRTSEGTKHKKKHELAIQRELQRKKAVLKKQESFESRELFKHEWSIAYKKSKSFLFNMVDHPDLVDALKKLEEWDGRRSLVNF